MVTDSGQIVVREQWDRPYKDGSSLFRFHFSVANICKLSWCIEESDETTDSLSDVIAH